jgi:hypothetical protein
LTDADVVVLVGLDIDRPRSDFRHLPHTPSEARQVVEYLAEVFPIWRSAGVAWTSFLCGSFLEILDELHLADDFASLLAGFDPVDGEIACHTYCHRPIAVVPGRVDLTPMSNEQLLGDLTGNEERIFRMWPKVDHSALGFRAPYGTDLLPDDTIAILSGSRRYSSSLLRSQDHPLGPPLVENGRLRQPFQYKTGLWELPSHGYHDTYFADLSGTSRLGRIGTTDALEHYRSLVRDAVTLSEQSGAPIFVGLTLHPYAMSVYDPRGELLLALQGELGAIGSSFVGYGRALERLEA